MNSKFFTDHIMEELDGAVEYAKKAIDVKPTHPKWAKVFNQMSKQELQHAGNFRRMFELWMSENKEKMTESDTEMYDSAIKKFTTSMIEIDSLCDFCNFY